jgi:hypothetical protein
MIPKLSLKLVKLNPSWAKARVAAWLGGVAKIELAIIGVITIKHCLANPRYRFIFSSLIPFGILVNFPEFLSNNQYYYVQWFNFANSQNPLVTFTF